MLYTAHNSIPTDLGIKFLLFKEFATDSGFLMQIMYKGFKRNGVHWFKVTANLGSLIAQFSC